MPAVAKELLKSHSISPDDLSCLPDRGRGYELVDGELKEVAVSFLSSYTAGRIFRALSNFVEPRGLGWVSPEGTSFRCFPDDPNRVRRADVAFHELARLSGDQALEEGHCSIAPDLAVEVISSNDLGYEIEEKRNEWLEAGVKLVWLVYPVRQTILAYHADGAVKQYRRSDTISGDPVLPDFRVDVADLFKLPSAASG